MASSRASSDQADADDIEELHRLALLQGSTTYTDPSTGFTCFTELLHLRRGQCCGNQCRHCPYGWIHVRRTNNNTGGDARRPAVVASGDATAVQARLQTIKQQQQEHQLLQLQQQQQQQSNNSSIIESSKKTATNKKTGGRHGGRLTEKNVPYTRGGDTGMSSLLTGERRSKTDDAFEAMGTVDELCSIVGVAHAELLLLVDTTETSNGTGAMGADDFNECLLQIMSRLFDIGSHLAKPAKTRSRDADDSDDSDKNEDDDAVNSSNNKFVADGVGGGFDSIHIDELEDWIDQLTEDLPELRSFILPTGSPTAAQLHVARCVCRRAERRVLPLVTAGVCDPTALQYLNRLSDFFFTAARWVNLQAKRPEIQYRRPTRASKQRDRVAVALEDDKKATTTTEKK